MDTKNDLIQEDDLSSSSIPTGMFTWSESDVATPDLTLDESRTFICTDLNVLNDLDVAVDITVGNDVTVENDLDVTGDADIGGDLTVTGNRTITGTTKVRAYQSSAQSISSATTSRVLLQTEEYDALGEFADSKFTATTAGYYIISGSVSMSLAAADYIHCYS